MITAPSRLVRFPPSPRSLSSSGPASTLPASTIPEPLEDGSRSPRLPEGAALEEEPTTEDPLPAEDAAMDDDPIPDDTTATLEESGSDDDPTEEPAALEPLPREDVPIPAEDDTTDDAPTLLPAFDAELAPLELLLPPRAHRPDTHTAPPTQSWSDSHALDGMKPAQPPPRPTTSTPNTTPHQDFMPPV